MLYISSVDHASRQGGSTQRSERVGSGSQEMVPTWALSASSSLSMPHCPEASSRQMRSLCVFRVGR